MGTKLATLLAAVLAGTTLAAAPADAAESPMGSRPDPGTNLADAVPGLRVGLDARHATFAEGGLFAVVPRKRCAAYVYVSATLVGTLGEPFRRTRPVGRSSLRLRGAPARSLKVSARRADSGGIDPYSAVALVGHLPPGLVPGEARRTVLVTLSASSEDEGCLKVLRRDVRRLSPRLYLRAVAGAAALPPAQASPTLRVDWAAYDRLGGLAGSTGGVTELTAAGDLDGDGRGDLLEEGEDGDPRTPRAVVRYGGPPALSDALALGSRGFRLAGRFDDVALGSTVTAGGDFTGDRRDDLAIGEQGTQQRGRRRRPAQEPVLAVIPGGRYVGTVDARRPPAGTWHVTVKPGCSPFETRVDAVGDVNGDGIGDIAVDRPDGCGRSRAGIVFGGRTGTISLDALGPAGITLTSDELPGDFSPAGDINGDGLDDVALFSSLDLDDGNDEIKILLGRRSAGPVSLKSDAGVVTLARRRCNDLTEVAPAGDLDGDGDDELAIGIKDCSGRELAPTVGIILAGAPGLRGTRRLTASGGTEIRSRFGPLGLPQIAAGYDVAGGPGPDVALGFAGAGPRFEGETWVISDVRLGETLTLGSVGGRGLRLIGPTYREAFGADLVAGPDRTGDGRPDLSILAAEAEFAGRSQVASVYTLAPTGAAAPRCASPRSGAGRVAGTDGGDRLTGSAGADRLVGFLGSDCLTGGPGADRLVGDPGDDTLDGGPERDKLAGGSGRDRLSGGSGADVLDGGPQADRLLGGAGADHIYAGDGPGDQVAGGGGADVINSSDGRRDFVDCGPGRDRAVADPGDRLRGCERVDRRSPREYDD